MVNLQVGCNAFWTEPAFVNGKIVSRFEAYHVIVLDQQIHPTLNRTIRTMCRHDAIDDPIGTPTAEWRVVQMWPKCLEDLFEIAYFSHD